MIKKYLLLAILCCLCSAAFAQSMSDEQVLTFLVEQKKAGTPQNEIVPMLLKKGVKVEQLQRVRKLYERQQSDIGQMESKTSSQNNEDKRQRIANRASDNNYADGNAGPANGRQVAEEISFMDIDSVIMRQNKLREYQQSQIYGHNIFNNKNLTFEPTQNMPTPSNYRLGPGDKVIIDIWGASQKTIDGTISPDGAIVIDNVGPVKLSGLTVREATRKLRGVLGRYYASSQISLSLGETRTIQVQVMGEVQAPGTYTLSSLATAFNALYAAGGIGDLGTLREIKVMRGGRQIAAIDIYDYIQNGVLSGNVRLQDNDVIVVGPYKTLVCLRGKVKRPMYYEMRNNETVAMLIDYAGGFTGDAYKKNIRLIRPGEKEYALYNIDEFDLPSFTLTNGDSVYVDSVLQRYSNMAEIKGAVMYPGSYQINGSIYTLRGLVDAANGLREDAFDERVIIHRQKDDLTLEAITVNLKNVMSGVDPDVPLKKNDKVIVPNKTEIIGERYFDITGQVNYPGKYHYAENTTVKDLILQAGGLTDAASLAKVDVYRRVHNKNATEASDTISQLFTLDLSEGLQTGNQEFELHPFDRVVVRKSPDYIVQQNVFVRGCVNFEGSYSMGTNNYRISDLIKDAGGLTEFAYPKGARLERMLTSDEKKQREEAYRAQQIALYEESMNNTEKNYQLEKADSILQLKLAIGNRYAVELDLEEALKHPESKANILLKNGDEISIPQYSNTVKISGDVMRPSSVYYKEGETLSYYINRAGGFGDNARKKKTYIIYMNGSVKLANKHFKKEIEPGCEIVVPSKLASNKLTPAEKSMIATSTASFATLMVAISRIIN